MKPLSPREIEVVSLMVSGVTDSVISRKLGITTSTMKQHLAHVKEKMNAKSRVEVAVIWTQLTFAERAAFALERHGAVVLDPNADIKRIAHWLRGFAELLPVEPES